MAAFAGWEFSCDLKATVDAYARASRGDAETCGCDRCLNFVAARDQIFPETFLALLDSLGIDSRKGGEVEHFGLVAPGLHLYCGRFHFVGVLTRAGNFPEVELAPGFWVSLSKAPIAPLRVFLGLPLVAVIFSATRVPWVLDEPAPL